MNMYENISNAIEGEFSNDSVYESFEEAYEKFYHLVSRLADMDDFSSDILNSIKTRMDSGDSFINAFRGVIDSDYEFADFSYFRDSFEYFKDELLTALTKSINAPDPAFIWNSEINWLFSNSTINVNSKDYTLSQLRDILEGVDNNESKSDN